MAYDMYQEKILEHYRKPRNSGHLPNADRSGTESNPLCGDKITMELKLDPSSSKVEDIKFSGDGCAISVACASMLTIEVKGKALKVVGDLKQADIEKLAGVPLSPVRIKCAMTGLVALQHAISNGSQVPKPESPA